MGAFTFFKTSLNDLWSGALTATVDNPAHVLKGTIGFLGSTIVRGPGQKASRISETDVSEIPPGGRVLGNWF